MSNNIEMVEDFVAVVRGRKSEQLNGMFASVEPSANQGIVLYKGPQANIVHIGQKVYFGKNIETMKILNDEVAVMRMANIVAVVNAEN